MAAIVEGASIVRVYQGAYTNVLTYRRHCDACGYLAPTVSTIVSLPSEGASSHKDASYYEAEGFSCPDCANYQAVRIQLEEGKEAIYQKD